MTNEKFNKNSEYMRTYGNKKKMFDKIKQAQIVFVIIHQSPYIALNYIVYDGATHL